MGGVLLWNAPTRFDGQAVIFIAKDSIQSKGKDFLMGVIYTGLIYFFVNAIAIGIFNVTGFGLVIVNILPTIFGVLIILHALDKL